MVTDKNSQESTQKIFITCSCGKRLAALPSHAGKRLRCPACAQQVHVPTTTISQTILPPVKMEDSTNGTSRTMLIVLWSAVSVLAIGCIAFTILYSYLSRQTKITKANDRVSKAVVAADAWIAGESSLDGEAVEQQLTNALGSKDVTEKSSGESMLRNVQRRREQLAEQARIDRLQQEADDILHNAKSKINEKHIPDAIVLLQKYIAHPHATKRNDAQRLLVEADTAISDKFNFDALVVMSKTDFEQSKITNVINDGKVTHPMLLAVRYETIQRNLDKAMQRRLEIKNEEEKRREAEHLAAMEKERQKKEQQRMEDLHRPLKVFLGGELTGTNAAAYRSRPKPKLKEEKKDNAGSVFDRYDQPNWESKYVVGNIVLAPGAIMEVSVANYSGEKHYAGEHSEWSWTIALAVPPDATAYRGVGFDYAIGDKVKSCYFDLSGSGELHEMILSLYSFTEHQMRPIEYYKPIDHILRQMVSVDEVKYRITTGPQGFGPSVEGKLPQETIKELRKLIAKAKYKNWNDQGVQFPDE